MIRHHWLVADRVRNSATIATALSPSTCPIYWNNAVIMEHHLNLAHCASVIGMRRFSSLAVATMFPPPSCGTPLHRHRPYECGQRYRGTGGNSGSSRCGSLVNASSGVNTTSAVISMTVACAGRTC
jgi:hypothetical protein